MKRKGFVVVGIFIILLVAVGFPRGILCQEEAEQKRILDEEAAWRAEQERLADERRAAKEEGARQRHDRLRRFGFVK